MGLFKSKSKRERQQGQNSPATSDSRSPHSIIRNEGANTSTSNLSATSTLLPEPQNKSRQRMTEYEAYIYHSTRQQLAAEAAQRERMRKRGYWAEDHWHGGFGQSANRDWKVTENMRRAESGETGVRAWLGSNGLTR